MYVKLFKILKKPIDMLKNCLLSSYKSNYLKQYFQWNHNTARTHYIGTSYW